MSTTTSTTPAATASKSLASSTAFKTFAIVFGFSTAALYVLCDMMNWPLFTYHPATNQVDLFYAPPRRGEGPAMYWYGWTATSLLGAAVLGVLATLLRNTSPEKSRWRSCGSSRSWRFRCCSIR
jgi:hypothetical protein